MPSSTSPWQHSHEAPLWPFGFVLVLQHAEVLRGCRATSGHPAPGLRRRAARQRRCSQQILLWHTSYPLAQPSPAESTQSLAWHAGPSSSTTKTAGTSISRSRLFRKPMPNPRDQDPGILPMSFSSRKRPATARRKATMPTTYTSQTRRPRRLLHCLLR